MATAPMVEAQKEVNCSCLARMVITVEPLLLLPQPDALWQIHTMKHMASLAHSLRTSRARIEPTESSAVQASLLGRFLPWGGGVVTSSEPAVGLHIASQAATSLLSLLVLTASSLERWQVGSHKKLFVQRIYACFRVFATLHWFRMHCADKGLSGMYVRIRNGRMPSIRAPLPWHRYLWMDSRAYFQPTICKHS